MLFGGSQIAALFACGLGFSVWLTDRQSGTSRALALFVFATGIAIGLNAQASLLQAPLPDWVRVLGVVEALAFTAGTEWGLRVSRMVADEAAQPFGRRLVRTAQACGWIYAVQCAALPELRAQSFAGALRFGELPTAMFWMFAALPLLAGLLVFAAGLRLLSRRPDQAEAVRVMSMLVAMPLLTTGLILPREWSPLGVACGEIVFLIGILRYHVIQGARGQFMARFLSPQVAELVRERGLKPVVGSQRLRVSVVCCDIRGFTAYAERQAQRPERVLGLLREFYAAVGTVVAEHDGTVKDLAGDGVMILLGAPVPQADHAKRALALSRQLLKAVRPIVRKADVSLGLGVGVASGKVAAGIVGERARYEYAAVGPPVNLAARLCQQAQDGEIRIDNFTLDDSGETVGSRPKRRMIRGLREPVLTHVLRVDDF
ncbi:adenylate/guanylate cyclase domain-containing protein [Algiphilus sp. W345]|uniref:Adenylate/guanylate cyclase domain-containing protein n=1 Tax=Banduia mediterranea TaxID=3075609 RepID=A0ABU2WKP3_9GAMM|nr:adenylate/guanylate cyclase domain-containing protein [Algiphilus sp. W345]MDT0498453.1 adenylate/guanylate cyclase domain-containing protein [Algiphilus sp. W345]